ncbi:MAG: MerR family transcriptional regulator [Acidaminococcaceae bacterium]|nr:MerR family transcriptional regulator [Acidaminococcaceae bacterium]MDD4721189.1 MerR family transcriptional regulator [Acidaminococcaceae bacterium]
MNISEVSKEYGLSADTLRYYERIGLIPTVPRKKSGLRDYDEKACQWVNFIKCMRGAGLTIETLIEYVKLFQEGKVTIKARKKLLLDQRIELAARIKEMQKVLAMLDHKIDGYEECLMEFEDKLMKKQ